MRKERHAPAATTDHTIGFNRLKARIRSAGRRGQVVSCHAVLRLPPDAIPGPLGCPPQQPTCTPIPVAERRWLWRTAADWPMQLGCVHPPPLDGGAEVGADAPADEAEPADEADAADAEADADPEMEGFRVGVTGGGAAGEGLATPGSEIHVTPTFSDQQLGVCVGAVGNPARPQSVLVQLRCREECLHSLKGGLLYCFSHVQELWLKLAERVIENCRKV